MKTITARLSKYVFSHQANIQKSEVAVSLADSPS